MNSRQKIIDAVNGVQVPEVALPDVQGDWTTYPEPRAQFAQVLEAVGGRVIDVPEPASLTSCLQQLDAYRQATRIWSLVSGVDSAGGPWDSISDPHDFEPLECCIVPGEFAVAENGAVWLTDAVLPHRAALFVTQHLVLVVPADQIVQNMHEAYSRLTLGETNFGIFISGPSKTADIEQSLVIGAHGARSLSVMLLNG